MMVEQRHRGAVGGGSGMPEPHTGTSARAVGAQDRLLLHADVGPRLVAMPLDLVENGLSPLLMDHADGEVDPAMRSFAAPIIGTFR